MLRRSAQLLFLISVTAIIGCGGSGMATVKGKVTAGGEPVDGGDIIFAPVGEGKPSAGTVQSDGTFTLKSTDGEGAVVGQHKVMYTPRQREEREDGTMGPPSEFVDWGLPDDYTQEVKPGENDITIELQKK